MQRLDAHKERDACPPPKVVGERHAARRCEVALLQATAVTLLKESALQLAARRSASAATCSQRHQGTARPPAACCRSSSSSCASPSTPRASASAARGSPA
eukprot:TRINITY_DN24194_c0_g2_i8.p3 TRINITY_DN24194_c0_g2~~TRINITY_DN24194_c0_g2_i8.p3  ORF type:complete len:100 (+),score=9.67 TRINITY_DN24194_c0_g2_i8:482-781(+)